MDSFAFLRLKGEDSNWRALHGGFTGKLPWERVWGVFRGLFGVASNELLAVTMGSADQVAESIAMAKRLPGVTCEAALPLAATVRPTSANPLVQGGLYVLRFFDVAPAHYDEFVDLSRTAWETFEAADGYRAEPQGLFRLRDDAAERGLMLLVTWYDGLGSWQASRHPPAAAGQRFQRRGQLATSTVAYATRLIV